ncbi:MAG: hypothetical protein KC708_16745, partial [Anaerolineae bacterium]|nr:hypothetical protein [Anaerolineae bacterium]
TRKIGERRVGNKFRPGKVKRLDWNYHSFSLIERSFWPKTFAITFILAEKDHGGLSSFLQNLWLHVRVAVYIAIKKAADEAGKAIAAFLELPEIGPIIGKALSTVIRKIVDLALGWIFKLFGDEIFAPRTLEVTIPSRNWRFGPVLWGSMPSLFSWIYTERFTGFGGIYDLRCQWELYS